MEVTTLVGLAGVPVIVAVVELVKRTAAPPERWLPLVAVGVGVAINVLAAGWGTSPVVGAAGAGVVAGLAACGLYDARKVAR